MVIKNYIYIDCIGIERIFNQLPSINQPQKTTTTSQLNNSADATIKTNFLRKLLKLDFNLKNVDSKTIQSEYFYNATTEDKIQAIINFISNGKIEQLFDIIYSKNYIKSNIVVCKSLFRFLWAYDDTSQRQLYQSDFIKNPYAYKNLSFNFASSSQLHFYNNERKILDAIDNQNEIYVDMYFSGANLVREVRHITNNIKYNKDFIFSIIGELNQESKNIFSLKPYVIWRTSSDSYPQNKKE